MFRFFVTILMFSFVYAKHEIYDGHSIYEVTVQTQEQGDFLHFLEDSLGLDIWSQGGPSQAGQVLVAKDQKEEFEIKLRTAGIQFKVHVDNVKELLELEDQLLSAAASKSISNTSRTTARNGLSLDRVYTWEEIDAYMDLLGEQYPNVVTVVTAGRSFEGRPIRYLRISSTNFQDTSKPIVYMESLLHAREWITQAATLYAIQKLVVDITEHDLTNDIDWIIVPVANPDGYVHTHNSARYWRKNRATGYMISNFCLGVDLNRNFNIFWSTASSDNVCLDTFHGSAAFSEPETAIVRDILALHPSRVQLFLDIHSFGSMILFGYGNGVLPPNALTINLVGVQMAQAIDAVKLDGNPNYIVGNVAYVLYDASGSAADYAMAVGVPLAYTFELPGYMGAGQTMFGFLVDPAFIEQAGFETWEGIKVAARYARSSYRTRNM